jgi:hypothetical protein
MTDQEFFPERKDSEDEILPPAEEPGDSMKAGEVTSEGAYVFESPEPLPPSTGADVPPPIAGAVPPPAALPPRSNRTLWIVLIVALLLLCCCCLLIAGAAIWGMTNYSDFEYYYFLPALPFV